MLASNSRTFVVTCDSGQGFTFFFSFSSEDFFLLSEPGLAEYKVPCQEKFRDKLILRSSSVVFCDAKFP